MKNSYANFKCQFRDGYVKEVMTILLCNSNSTAVAITIRRFLTALAIVVSKIFAHLTEYTPFERIVTLIAFNFYYE